MKLLKYVQVPVLALLLLGPGPTSAQEAAPLPRGEVERLITGGTYTQAEVAEIVRRSCLSFSPTEEDLARFRDLGAGGEVLAAIRECGSEGPREEATPEVLDLVIADRSLALPVDTVASLRLRIRKDDRARAGVALVLDGSDSLPDVERRLETTTDSAGNAVFRLPTGTEPGRYSFRVLARGFWLEGENEVSLLVVPGAPVAVAVRPDRIEVEPGRGAPLDVTVTVTDRFGNPVPEARVTLRGDGPDAGGAIWRASTGSDGRAHLSLSPEELAGVESLTAMAGQNAIADVAIARPTPGEAETEEPVVAEGEAAEPKRAQAAEPEAAAPADTTPPPPPTRSMPAPRPASEVTATASVWGGNTFDNGRSFGVRAARLSVSPSPAVTLWGRFDHRLAMVRPYVKRGEVDDLSFFGGFAVDWGAGDRFSTWVEGGRRQHAVTDEWETLGHLRQTIRFGEGGRPAFERGSIMVGGFVGDWFDRTDWGVEAGFGIPASPAFRLEGLGAVTRTVAMRPDPTLVSARDVRFELTGRIRFAGWEVAPTGVVGSVSDSDLGEAREGGLYEGRLYVESAPIGGLVRMLGFFRVQDLPGSDDFSQAAVGIRVGAERRDR